jgi:hypothetical protein
MVITNLDKSRLSIRRMLTMKKIIVLTLTVLMVLSLVAPGIAQAQEPIPGDTSVNVATGGGEYPVVKCKWESEPNDPNYESGDPTHITDGFQILPPLEACTTKTICYYAVVTDEEDGGEVSQVFADVYHPAGSPEPYGPSVVGGVMDYPYFKYEVKFEPWGTGDAAEQKVMWAYEDGLITFNPDYDLEDVLYELDKGTAWLWYGCEEIDYEQPAGMYDVYAFAVDANNNLSPYLWNQFYYMPLCGIEVDFTGINFGSTNLGVEKMIAGDTIWDCTPGINHATVRNIGNTWAHVKIMFDDMGFGMDSNDNWNVNFDARMGSDNAYYVGGILPYEWVTLPNALDLSHKDELDISIKILKGFGAHTGVITLGCEIEPFDGNASIVDGLDARGDCCPDENPG